MAIQLYARINLLAWPYEPVTIEMNHMLRLICKPDFCFPSDIRCKLPEFLCVRKCCNVNFSVWAVLCEFFKLNQALR